MPEQEPDIDTSPPGKEQSLGETAPRFFPPSRQGDHPATRTGVMNHAPTHTPVPVRVRFRPAAERLQEGDEDAGEAQGNLNQRAGASPAPTRDGRSDPGVRPGLFFSEREAEHQALEEAITLLQRDLEQVQQGNLQVQVRSTHEKLQPVVDTINAMIGKFRAALGDVQKATQAVDEHVLEIQQSSQALVHNAGQQEQQVHTVSRVIDGIAVTIQHIARYAEKMSQVTVEAMDVTLESQGTVDRAVDGMGQVREVTMQTARVMKRLGESVQEINDAVHIISDLTTRMNLLALNAAIEAARAGEHGQGFAMIAQEMRTLALHSADAARKVAARIRTIQQETATVALSVEQTTRQVVTQTELVTQTGIALEAIGVVTEQMTGLVKSICSAAENQLQVSVGAGLAPALAAQSIASISRMTGDITHHTCQVQQSLASLVELNNELRSRVSAFHVNP